MVENEKPKKTRRKKNYLNNADLLLETQISQENGRMTEKLGHMLMILCDRYRVSKTGNFTRYTYFDEMKSMALENLIKNAWQKFDPERYSNAFAWYTQCVHNSYLQYIKYEKRHQNIRDKLLVDAGLEASFAYMEENRSGYGDLEVDNSDDIVDNNKDIELTDYDNFE